MKYKVGDKVRVRSWDEMKKDCGLDRDGDIKCKYSFTKDMKKFCGKIFTVDKVYEYEGPYELKGGEHFYFSDDMIEPVIDKKIVITTDGKTTLATLYDNKNVVKTAKAICSPDDEFDFQIGAKTAFDRLFVEPKCYSGKVVCIEANEGAAYTVGKIYEFKDGRVKIDNGNKIPSFPVRSLDEWNNSSCTYAKFIELKE